MSVSRLMSTCVTECTEDASLVEVYELIRQCEHGLVVVIDSEAHRVPIGVVSERSICEQLIARAKNPRGLTAGSVIDPRIRTIRERDNLHGISADELKSLAAIVVTNDLRQVCGIIPRTKFSAVTSTIAATHSSARIYVSSNARRSPATREIPALGWVQ